MPPGVFLVALLSTLGIASFTLVRVARLFATRREASNEVITRLDELESTVQGLQQELGEAQERLDFAERLLSAAREERRPGN
ncbi:MAG: hypothetical protein ABR537_00300 [Gemmatimonadales bacterium]